MHTTQCLCHLGIGQSHRSLFYQRPRQRTLNGFKRIIKTIHAKCIYSIQTFSQISDISVAYYSCVRSTLTISQGYELWPNVSKSCHAITNQLHSLKCSEIHAFDHRNIYWDFGSHFVHKSTTAFFRWNFFFFFLLLFFIFHFFFLFFWFFILFSFLIWPFFLQFSKDAKQTWLSSYGDTFNLLVS